MTNFENGTEDKTFWEWVWKLRRKYLLPVIFSFSMGTYLLVDFEDALLQYNPLYISIVATIFCWFIGVFTLSMLYREYKRKRRGIID